MPIVINSLRGGHTHTHTHTLTHTHTNTHTHTHIHTHTHTQTHILMICTGSILRNQVCTGLTPGLIKRLTTEKESLSGLKCSNNSRSPPLVNKHLYQTNTVEYWNDSKILVLVM